MAWQMYHTDKLDRQKYDELYYLIAEEIVKLLNAMFNQLK
jgi:hypothetical protein